jgi:hypothetical protein
MAHTLKPFRNYDEYDVVNLFAVQADQDANGVIASAGTVVKVAGNGFQPVVAGLGGTGFLGAVPVDLAGGAGSTYVNTVSDRFALAAKVTAAASGSLALGITLMGTQEYDENGEKLLFHPRKAAEKGVVVSGQAVPVLTRGIVTYSGSLISNSASAGDGVYLSPTAGELSTTAGNQTRVGTLLGTPVNNTAVVKLSF